MRAVRERALGPFLCSAVLGSIQAEMVSGHPRGSRADRVKAYRQMTATRRDLLFSFLIVSEILFIPLIVGWILVLLLVGRKNGQARASG